MSDLETIDLCSGYGQMQILRGVSTRVGSGEIVALLGPNGAGKSTLLRTVAGLVPAQRGQILLAGRDISRLPAHARARGGLVLVPEGRRLFPRMTVEENLVLGAWGAGSRNRSIEHVLELFPAIAERRRQLAFTLSGGEQQMVALGRALMRHPRVLLLDEPSMGLAPALALHVAELVRRISEESGVTVFLVEQNANVALTVSSRAYVLEGGRIALEGGAQELRDSDRVRSAYFGGSG